MKFFDGYDCNCWKKEKADTSKGRIVLEEDNLVLIFDENTSRKLNGLISC